MEKLEYLLQLRNVIATCCYEILYISDPGLMTYKSKINLGANVKTKLKFTITDFREKKNPLTSV